MPEVPEHLLARSRARRAALGGGGDVPAEGSSPAAKPEASADGGAPAEPTAAAALPVIEAEPTPEPVVRARQRVPRFVIPVLVALPFWAMLYAGAFGERHVEQELTPAQLGKQLYSARACSGCHGVNGEGITGPALDEVEKTFPDIADHMAWIKGGSQSVGVGNPYGDPAVGRVAKGKMPAFPDLTDAELEAVATYEREAFGG